MIFVFSILLNLSRRLSAVSSSPVPTSQTSISFTWSGSGCTFMVPAGAHIQGHGLARLHLQHHIHPLAGSPWQRHLHGQVYEIHLRMKISSESQLRKKAQKREIPRLQHMHSRAQHLYELSVPEEHRHLGFMHVEAGFQTQNPGSRISTPGRRCVLRLLSSFAYFTSSAPNRYTYRSLSGRTYSYLILSFFARPSHSCKL